MLGTKRVFQGWWIVLTGYLSQLVTVGATGWVFGVLILPMQKDLHWNRSEIVGVVTLARLVGGLWGFVLGPFVDRHGARALMTASALLAGACLIGTGLVQSSWQYYACWAVFGLSVPA